MLFWHSCCFKAPVKVNFDPIITVMQNKSTIQAQNHDTFEKKHLFSLKNVLEFPKKILDINFEFRGVKYNRIEELFFVYSRIDVYDDDFDFLHAFMSAWLNQLENNKYYAINCFVDDFEPLECLQNFQSSRKEMLRDIEIERVVYKDTLDFVDKHDNFYGIPDISDYKKYENSATLDENINMTLNFEDKRGNGIKNQQISENLHSTHITDENKGLNEDFLHSINAEDSLESVEKENITPNNIQKYNKESEYPNSFEKFDKLNNESQIRHDGDLDSPEAELAMNNLYPIPTNGLLYSANNKIYSIHPNFYSVVGSTKINGVKLYLCNNPYLLTQKALKATSDNHQDNLDVNVMLENITWEVLADCLDEKCIFVDEKQISSLTDDDHDEKTYTQPDTKNEDLQSIKVQFKNIMVDLKVSSSEPQNKDFNIHPVSLLNPLNADTKILRNFSEKQKMLDVDFLFETVSSQAANLGQNTFITPKMLNFFKNNQSGEYKTHRNACKVAFIKNMSNQNVDEIFCTDDFLYEQMELFISELKIKSDEVLQTPIHKFRGFVFAACNLGEYSDNLDICISKLESLIPDADNVKIVGYDFFGCENDNGGQFKCNSTLETQEDILSCQLDVYESKMAKSCSVCTFSNLDMYDLYSDQNFKSYKLEIQNEHIIDAKFEETTTELKSVFSEVLMEKFTAENNSYDEINHNNNTFFKTNNSETKAIKTSQPSIICNIIFENKNSEFYSPHIKFKKNIYLCHRCMFFAQNTNMIKLINDKTPESVTKIHIAHLKFERLLHVVLTMILSQYNVPKHTCLPHFQTDDCENTCKHDKEDIIVDKCIPRKFKDAAAEFLTTLNHNFNTSSLSSIKVHSKIIKANEKYVVLKDIRDIVQAKYIANIFNKYKDVPEILELQMKRICKETSYFFSMSSQKICFKRKFNVINSKFTPQDPLESPLLGDIINVNAFNVQILDEHRIFIENNDTLMRILLESCEYFELCLKKVISLQIYKSQYVNYPFFIKYHDITVQILLKGNVHKTDKGMVYVSYLYDDALVRTEKWRSADLIYYKSAADKLVCLSYTVYLKMLKYQSRHKREDSECTCEINEAVAKNDLSFTNKIKDKKLHLLENTAQKEMCDKNSKNYHSKLCEQNLPSSIGDFGFSKEFNKNELAHYCMNMLNGKFYDTSNHRKRNDHDHDRNKSSILDSADIVSGKSDNLESYHLKEIDRKNVTTCSDTQNNNCLSKFFMSDVLTKMCRLYGVILSENSWGMSKFHKQLRYLLACALNNNKNVKKCVQKTIKSLKEDKAVRRSYLILYELLRDYLKRLGSKTSDRSENYTSSGLNEERTILFNLPLEFLAYEVFLLNVCPKKLYGNNKHLNDCLEELNSEIDLFDSHQHDIESIYKDFENIISTKETSDYKKNLVENYLNHFKLIDNLSLQTNGRFTFSPCSILLISEVIDDLNIDYTKFSAPLLQLQDLLKNKASYDSINHDFNYASESISNLSSKFGTQNLLLLALKLINTQKIDLTMRINNKEQLGGNREISIMSSEFRVLQSISEQFFKEFNMYLDNEMTDKGDTISRYIHDSCKVFNPSAPCVNPIDEDIKFSCEICANSKNTQNCIFYDGDYSDHIELSRYTHSTDTCNTDKKVSGLTNTHSGYLDSLLGIFNNMKSNGETVTPIEPDILYESSETFCQNLDQTRWGPNFNTATFGLLAFYISTKTKHAYLPALILFLCEFKIFETVPYCTQQYFNNKIAYSLGGRLGRNHMGQGIFSRSSSAYHSLIVKFLSKIKHESLALLKIPTKMISFITSDDCSIIETISFPENFSIHVNTQKTANFNIFESKINPVLYFSDLNLKLMKYFGIKSSDYKNTFSFSNTEFNSQYLGRKYISRNDIKFICSCLDLFLFRDFSEDMCLSLMSYRASINSHVSQIGAFNIARMNYLLCLKYYGFDVKKFYMITMKNIDDGLLDEIEAEDLKENFENLFDIEN